MFAFLRHNCKAAHWLMAILLFCTANVSHAAWQCLDGHLCPPGCVLLPRRDAAQSPASCCVTKQGHCSMCLTGTRITERKTQTACTSSVCVLRIQAFPDAVSVTHTFDFVDTPAILPTITFTSDSIQLVALIASTPSRAPPRTRLVLSHSPRAPPVLL